MRRGVLVLFVVVLLLSGLAPAALAQDKPKTDFLPSKDGWDFKNINHSNPTLEKVKISKGFYNCGGMCFSALDYYYQKKSTKDVMDTEKMRDYIAKRQEDTLGDWDGGMWWQVTNWACRPRIDHDYEFWQPDSRGELTLEEEWPKLRDQVKEGKPTVICLMMCDTLAFNSDNLLPLNDLDQNHQVIVYDYDYDKDDDSVHLRVYDCNFPNDDHVRVHFHTKKDDHAVKGKLQYKVGGDWEDSDDDVSGFFIVDYDKSYSAHINRIKKTGEDAGTVGRRVWARDWTQGWTIAETFSAKGRTFLFLLKSTNGIMHINHVKSDGSVGRRTAEDNWSKGWTSACTYRVKSPTDKSETTYLMILKKKLETKSGNNVKVYKLSEEGTVVSPAVFEADWTQGWTLLEPFTVGSKQFVLVGSSTTGKLNVRSIDPAAGIPSGVLHEKDWTQGWTSAAPYVIGGKTYILFLREWGTSKNGERAVIWRMGADGSFEQEIAGYKPREDEVSLNPLLPPRIETLVWPETFTQLCAYSIGDKVFTLRLSTTAGWAVVQEVNPDGTLGKVLERSTRSLGWTSALVYKAPEDTMLLLLKEKD